MTTEPNPALSEPRKLSEAYGDRSDPLGRERAVSEPPRAMCEDGEGYNDGIPAADEEDEPW